MHISFAATNPCHLWDMAIALSAQQAMGIYYSGYPRWKLADSLNIDIRCHSSRTLVTYFLHGKVPERWRPSNRSLFRWQDVGFDRWVASALQPTDFLHGIPGQCLESFRRARSLGIRTVLNHATGPAKQVARILAPEYQRLCLNVAGDGGITTADLSRIESEFSCADFHCCASSVVRDQLITEGIPDVKIWVVPYGANPIEWNDHGRTRKRVAGEPFRLLFAGQVSLRKGLRFLLRTLENAGNQAWQLDVMGPLLEESRADRESYRGKIPIVYHGAVSRAELAEAMRQSDLLVLPSLEEGFGLVVVQALSCGLPCAVSSMVGAKDLIVEGVNGSVSPVGDVDVLLSVLQMWENSPRRVSGKWDWSEPARKLIELSMAS